MALANVPQKLKEAKVPWQVRFADTPEHPEVGLEQGKQALGSILMHLAARIFLLGMIDVLMDMALQRLIAAGRVRIQPTARLDGDVGRLLHRCDGKIPGRLDDDKPLATHPNDNRRSIFIIMPPAGLAFLAATTCSASQR